ncbi:ISAs1 family transposase [Ktedonobacter racemifer]|uniref:Transposase IS4 family protein n=1 Tax=Ktedonobacter racemifer DSM 44963 TaxID=485913 RepID=D6TQX5_KTERA|nr:ISAs1 family transposase [Ktedonobacter racemifer]EFH85846.1 transposase IS4 family protein [Ktedonobacter racemifer DSM 44963]
MYLSIFGDEEKAFPEAMSIDPASFYAAFSQVKDGRGKRGKRYPLPLILTLLLLGKLAGETSIHGILEWIQERKPQIQSLLGWPRCFPTNSTCTFALMHCESNEIAAAFASVLLKARAIEQCGDEPSRLHTPGETKELTQLAMDGKAMRGTQKHQAPNQPPVHLLSLYECQSGIVIAQRAVAKKENEISAAATLLHPALVKGRILSADAMHTQKKWCASVQSYGGYYLLIAKLNQPQLYEDLSDFFEDKDAQREEWQYARTTQKGHGRLEIRELWSSTQMNAWFEPQWAGIAQVFRLRRHSTHLKDGTTREEIVYGLTNLTPRQATAARLLAYQQTHWRIENRLHYRRDVTMGEDASQVRLAGAPEALAALNGGVLALMDWLNVKNAASAMRHFCAQPHEALQLLCGTLSR